MSEINYFRKSFKYFKQKRNPEGLCKVLNFDMQNVTEDVILLEDFMKRSMLDEEEACGTCKNLGLVTHHQWQIFSHKNLEGFFYIRNPFTTGGQPHWIKKCLEQYIRKPSVTNLDIHHKGLDNIWLSSEHKYIDKLTWATLGYHYNWDAKTYDRSHKSTFPKCLADLIKHVAFNLHFSSYNPDAAILNFYNTKSCLGIHNDHSEEALDEPIISISFGQTAIFLIGTESCTEEPVPMLLRSGDIILLSGPCRLSYHAVPAIIEEPLNVLQEDKREEFYEYIKKHRINISARQVYSNAVKPC